jgi:hypothetical protein
MLGEVVATAVGAEHRHDPVAPATGGPAGNARLTAWVGLLLLAAFAVEGGTLLSLHGLLTVHLVVGAFLVPVALVKTATTGWRILRYYVGDARYRAAGPPPLLLRLLGPLVVVTALAVLGSGLALVAVGAGGRRDAFISFGGFSLTALTLHKATFVLWFAATAAHVLARTVPALQLATGRVGAAVVPGAGARLGVVAGTVVAGVVAGALLVHLGGWHGGFQGDFRDGFPDGRHDGAAVTNAPGTAAALHTR